MTLRRLVLVLGAGLVALMSVVLLRADATRLHFLRSELQRDAGILRQELREKELELARLRNPSLIRARLSELSADERISEDAPASARRRH